MNRYWWNFTHL